MRELMMRWEKSLTGCTHLYNPVIEYSHYSAVEIVFIKSTSTCTIQIIAIPHRYTRVDDDHRSYDDCKIKKNCKLFVKLCFSYMLLD